jgi:cytochrome b561
MVLMNSEWLSSKDGYGKVSIFFHWVMLLLIVATYVMMDIKSFFPKGSASRELLANLHFTLGLSVFLLVWFRLVVRLVNVSPVVVPALEVKQALLAKGMHVLLYVLMISLPILGWLTLSARGKPVPFFWAEFPALIDKSQEMAKLLKELHETGATIGYVLIGLHAAAALFHHYVKGDNTLKLMLPKS